MTVLPVGMMTLATLLPSGNAPPVQLDAVNQLPVVPPVQETLFSWFIVAVVVAVEFDKT